MSFPPNSPPGDQRQLAVFADLAAVLGGVLAFVSGFLPFIEQPDGASQGGSTIKGFQWFGVVYIGFAMAIGLLAAASATSRSVSRWRTLGLALVNLLLLIGYLAVFDSERGSLRHGAGLWLLLAAVLVQACALLVGGLISSGRLTLGQTSGPTPPAAADPNPQGYPTYPPNYAPPGQQYAPQQPPSPEGPTPEGQRRY